MSAVQTLWSHVHSAAWRGVSQTRERGLILAWDARHTLFLFNRSGQLQAQWPCPQELSDAVCAEDGGSFAAVSAQGDVWLLAPDLTVRWQRHLSTNLSAIALEAFGRQVAVSDGAGTLYLLDHQGRTVWQAPNPRPLHHLAFVPEEARIVASADFGLAACFDAAGRCVWRDGLVAHVGSLAVSGDGTTLVLACFSEGLCCYRNNDPKTRRFLPDTAPVHRAALSYDGQTILTTDRHSAVTWRNADGKVPQEMKCDAKPVALALDALGERAVIAFGDGRLSMVVSS